ncbi:uncharacterized protein LOC121394352 [Xenopus laevis]|uniref:Uncharacterized protein LOC121394352 n=1 Tax=Xenopus laevis TaxID=8355 RepID=A0A8J1KUX3_XENLA|nr:uncharacterized protein LOC121394352 [Xenopus laevis]
MMSQLGSYSQDATTFAYTEADAIRILGEEQSNHSFLTEPTGDNLTRELEKEKRRLTGLELHSITLKEYYKLRRIPRGLRVNLRPTIFNDNTDFAKRYEQIVNKCSFDILLLNIEYLQNAIPEVMSRIKAIELQLKNALRSDEYKEMLTRTDEAIAKHRRLVEERKRTKFHRDAEDYRTGNVYQWNAASTGGTQRNRRRDAPRDHMDHIQRKQQQGKKQQRWKTPDERTPDTATESSSSSCFLDYSPPRHVEGKKGAGGTKHQKTFATETRQQPPRTVRNSQKRP